MHDRLTGIILLAAGASVRMGRPKQLLDIDGESLIRRSARAALASGCGPVVVVLGANAAAIRPELTDLEVHVRVNSEWPEGMSASIRVGLQTVEALIPNVAGAMLMLADQPRVTAHSVVKIIRAPCQTESRIVAARFNGTVGAPAFFPRKYFGELKNLSGSGGAKALLERYKGNVVPVNLPEAALDLDTPGDFAAFSKNGPAKTVALRAPEEQRHFLMQNYESIFPDSLSDWGDFNSQTRRQFIRNVTVAGTAMAVAPAFGPSASVAAPAEAADPPESGTIPVKLRVNGIEQMLQLDPRVTLLDALREHLHLTGSKKGCDHGQCGACTVLVNGRRINSCLALAVVHDGDEITTIEGLAAGNELHPVQAAFLDHDGFQCGYCTPGQICSAVALLQEGHAGDDAEIREWMSGNLCRCGAYVNIVAAIREAQAKTKGTL